MSRFAPQGDLFGPVQRKPQPEPECELEHITELSTLLRQLRGADVHPWTPLSEAIQREYSVQALGRRAGPEGEQLAADILEESERLFARSESI